MKHSFAQASHLRLGLLGTVLTATLYLLSCTLPSDFVGQAVGIQSAPQPELQALAKKYHIQIKNQNPPKASWPGVSYTALKAADINSSQGKAYQQLFVKEFNKYPIELIKVADLKQVAIVKNLKYSSQERSALPDFLQEILYLDAFAGSNNPLYQRHVVHHEFYHLLEEEVYGNVYFKDPEWGALNPDDFRYGDGGANARTGPQYDLTHPEPGFINLYSTSGLEEDKAEIFAALMVPEERKLISAWAQSDPVLKAKIQKMKNFLKAKVPAMNNTYWYKF